MKNLKLIFFILFLLICFWSCDNATDPELNLNSVPKENLIAFTARFTNPDLKGGSSRKIVIADYYNPTNYKIVTDTALVAVEAVFSRDKNLLLFGDKSHFVHHLQLYLYDINDGTVGLLSNSQSTSDFPVLGTEVVWNYNDSGFYFTQSDFGSLDVLFYSLLNRTIEIFHNGKGYSVYPVGLKGKDTLIVFSNNTVETGEQIGLYFMDMGGNYLSRIKNPYLELINRNGITKKGAYSPNWNDELGLFVYTEIDSTVKGYKISVTDLTGNYYKTYTSGDYIDDHPAWGPNGKTILFDRHEITDYGPINLSIMLIDRSSGEVREYIDPAKINGAISLGVPDF